MAHLCILFPQPHPQGSWSVNTPRGDIMTHPGNHATGAVETGHKGPPLSTDPLYPTASWGTGTAIISRWISCVHTAFRPHRFREGWVLIYTRLPALVSCYWLHRQMKAVIPVSLSIDWALLPVLLLSKENCAFRASQCVYTLMYIQATHHNVNLLTV